MSLKFDRLSHGKREAACVHIDDPWDLARWFKQWGCTQDELKAAVKATGSVNVDTLEAYLESKGQKQQR